MARVDAIGQAKPSRAATNHPRNPRHARKSTVSPTGCFRLASWRGDSRHQGVISIPAISRLTPAPTFRRLGLVWLLLSSLAAFAAAPTEHESYSGEYVARVTATDTKDAPGIRYPLTVTITTRVTKRTAVFPTEVSALSKWVALWATRKDCFIFFAPQAEGWSVAYVPETNYGPIVARELTDEERALGEKTLEEKYGTRKPERPLSTPRFAPVS
ncbi:MAG: hypothetical protein EXS38_11425 [Opitutus sp.]|nr:hypothetical protein [Opitutus sp.]